MSYVPNNIASNIGDRIVFSNEIPIKGITGIIDYTDSITGLTGERYFDKFFRFSLNGVTFSDIKTLDNVSLNDIPFNQYDDFIIELTYIRSGTDETGDLVFNSFQLDANYSTYPVETGVIQTSIFASEVVTQSDYTAKLAFNLLRKIYDIGIVPEYIDRKTDEYDADDFVSFWKSISSFLSMFVGYFHDNFGDMFDESEMLSRFLSSRGLYLSGNETISQLQDLSVNYYKELRKRGSIGVFDGEFKRLVQYNLIDEFILNVVPNKLCGWNMDNSSPLYRGMTQHIYANKSWQNEQDITSDLALFPLKNSVGLISVSVDGGKSVIDILSVPDTQKSGIGFQDSTSLSKLIIVDNTVDYEITFWAKMMNAGATLNFSCRGYGVANLYDNTTKLKSVIDNSVNEAFFLNQALAVEDTWFFVRGIIYGKDHTLLSSPDSDTNVHLGNNLKMNSATNYILPEIYVEGDGSDNELKLWDIKVKPLSTPKNKAFIQQHNLLEMWIKDNNNSLSHNDIEQIMEEELLPYNSKLQINYL